MNETELPAESIRRANPQEGPEALPVACYVLTRADLTFHIIAAKCPDRYSGTCTLYGQPTLCGQTTPTEPLGILQYTTAAPTENLVKCKPCLLAQNPAYDFQADLDARAAQVRVELMAHAKALRADLATTEAALMARVLKAS